MNKTILLPVVVAGALVAAMVIAAPQGTTTKAAVAPTLDRGAAYHMAQAD